MFKLCLLVVALFRADATVLFARPGENVSLPCFFEPGATGAKYLCWYKQVAGDKPEMVTSFYVYLRKSHSPQKTEVVSNRLTVHHGENFFHLNISDVELSDTAMYYCGQTKLSVTSFDNGIFLVVRESSRLSILQRPTSITATPGGSVDLQCSMYPGTNNGHQRVYWFRDTMGDSRLGMVYVDLENGSECAKTSERRCVHVLPKQDVSLADAGMYYCAVASCGEIVFGEGTRLDVGGGENHTVLTHCLLGALLVSVIFNILLTVFIFKKSRRQQRPRGEITTQPSILEDNEDDESALPYVALNFKKRQSNNRRQRSPEDTVYAGLRLTHVD
uniref:uncharacterized protein LOC131125875 n=1 Tax=Doryrhamphus excisus TaxID=161450 RepID=UPI0025ADD264|nr:uncharacterized protein LOC131125875 [Doryrhamphus excisus]